MKPNEIAQCLDFPCDGVNHNAYLIPDIDIDPDAIRIVLISEAAPFEPNDYYYAKNGSLFQQTTLLAFKDAGFTAASIQELIDAGIYMTTAIKCAKVGYNIKAGPIRTCTRLLQAEIEQFHYLKAILLMGDVAIKSINYIAQNQQVKRVIPAGSTYKIRGGNYQYKGIPAFPSYLQAGPSFFIEKSKRKMIAEDIGSALALL